jgi:hypothetical protein
MDFINDLHIIIPIIKFLSVKEETIFLRITKKVRESYAKCRSIIYEKKPLHFHEYWYGQRMHDEFCYHVSYLMDKVHEHNVNKKIDESKKIVKLELLNDLFSCIIKNKKNMAHETKNTLLFKQSIRYKLLECLHEPDIFEHACKWYYDLFGQHISDDPTLFLQFN